MLLLLISNWNAGNTKSCARPKAGSQGSANGGYKGSSSKLNQFKMDWILSEGRLSTFGQCRILNVIFMFNILCHPLFKLINSTFLSTSLISGRCLLWKRKMQCIWKMCSRQIDQASEMCAIIKKLDHYLRIIHVNSTHWNWPTNRITSAILRKITK